MRYLPTYEAQTRIDVKAYLKLSTDAMCLWHAILLACQTPGIPVEDARMRAQLAAIWGATSPTYQALVHQEAL